MNANEVIASRANEIATGKRGGKEPVHPNDHVNMEQSSNDVIPTAIHVAAAVAMKESLVPALEHLAGSAGRRRRSSSTTSSRSAARICRTRRRSGWGRSSRGYAAQARLSVDARRRRRSARCASCRWAARPSARASTRTPSSRKQAIAVIAQKTGIDFVEAQNHFEAQAAQGRRRRSVGAAEDDRRSA